MRYGQNLHISLLIHLFLFSGTCSPPVDDEIVNAVLLTMKRRNKGPTAADKLYNYACNPANANYGKYL